MNGGILLESSPIAKKSVLSSALKPGLTRLSSLLSSLVIKLAVSNRTLDLVYI